MDHRNLKAESYENAVQSLLRRAREIGGEGFEDVQESEISELLFPETEKLSIEDLEEMVRDDTKEHQKEPEEDSEKEFQSCDSGSYHDSLFAFQTELQCDSPGL